MSDSRRLVIRFQQLAEVPDWAWDRTDVEFLCVSDNRLGELRVLDLRNNQVRDIPESIGDLP